MNKLLISEYPLLVLPSLATKIGLNEAIVLQQIHYWIENPNTGIQHEGFKWVHNTYAEWQKNFPFWTADGIRKIIYRLEESGVLVSAQTSKNPFDKTKSYRINYEKLDEMEFLSHVDVDFRATSFTETTVSDTNNTASGKNQPSTDQLPVEWQIAAGVEKVVMPDQKEAQYMDTANLIATGMGVNSHIAYGIAYTFMRTRGIIIPSSKVKGQRKAIREMMEMGVLPNHVQEATQKLMDDNMTVADLYSISKTAIALANPTEVKYTGAIEGIE